MGVRDRLMNRKESALYWCLHSGRPHGHRQGRHCVRILGHQRRSIARIPAQQLLGWRRKHLRGSTERNGLDKQLQVKDVTKHPSIRDDSTTDHCQSWGGILRGEKRKQNQKPRMRLIIQVHVRCSPQFHLQNPMGKRRPLSSSKHTFFRFKDPESGLGDGLSPSVPACVATPMTTRSRWIESAALIAVIAIAIAIMSKGQPCGGDRRDEWVCQTRRQDKSLDSCYTTRAMSLITREREKDDDSDI